MPEGPEILQYQTNLEPLIKDQQLINIQVQSGRYQRYPETWDNNLILPTTIQSLETKGKLLIWNLTNNQHIFIQHGMTGKWSLKEEKHNHLKFEFVNRLPIFFNDARNFGTIQFGNQTDKLQKLKKLGPDPFHEIITFQHIRSKLTSRKSIGEILLDQSFIAGTGNYLRAEYLYAAQISPFRPSNSLSQEEWTNLLQQINTLPHLSFQLGGATLRNYQSINGEKGKFSERFAVYGRTHDSAGHPVLRTIDGTKRAIWWVPDVQK